jgi:putative ABC transport system permease protein
VNVLWQKIFADLSEQKGRSVLALLSMAAGLFAVGALFGMVDLQLAAMDKAHRQAVPSHINLILQRPVDRVLLGQIAALPGVAAVEPMNQLSVHYRLGPDGPWALGTLVMRSDYAHQQFDRLQRVEGDWPGGGRLAVERLSARLAGLTPGAKVSFGTEGGEREFTIGGTLRHPFVKPPTFGGQLHFFADAATLEMFGVPSGQFRQLLVQVAGDYDADRVRQVASGIRAELGRAGVGVAAALLQDPERHWGRPFVAGINQVLQGMAVAALALGTLLIVTSTAARILQQTHQIGIMKSLGGGRTTILTIYLSEALLLGLAAVAVSLPAAVVAAWAGSRWFLDLFNIDFETFRVSLRAVGIVVLGGVLAPLGAALWPVLKGASLSIREAIASYGVGADFGSSRFDRWLDRTAAALLPTLYATALGNLFRRKGQLFLTQLALCLAGVVFLGIMSLVASLELTLNNELARTRYDVGIGLAADQPEERIRELVAKLPDVTHQEFWSRSPVELSFRGMPLRHGGTLGAQIVSFPPTSTLYRPLIVAGRWLNDADTNRRVLVLNAETARLSGIDVGDNVDAAFPGRAEGSWKVIGLYRWVTVSDYAVEPVYAPQAALEGDIGLRGMRSRVLLAGAVDSPERERDLADRLKTVFEEAGIPLDVYSSQARLEQREYARNQFRPALSMLLGLAAMMAAVGGIGLAGALGIRVMQRRREIGVLRAIGARSRTVFGLFMLEGLLQGLLAWMVSVPIAWILSPALARQLGQTMLKLDLDYVFNQPAVLIWLGVVFAIAALASVGPALSATRLSVRECLAYS